LLAQAASRAQRAGAAETRNLTPRHWRCSLPWALTCTTSPQGLPLVKLRQWERANALMPYRLVESGQRERSRPGERISDSQANRRSHIGVVVAMIGKRASFRKRMTKGAPNGDGPAIKARPVVAGDRMGC
jgi:hypothetical protein